MTESLCHRLEIRRETSILPAKVPKKELGKLDKRQLTGSDKRHRKLARSALAPFFSNFLKNVVQIQTFQLFQTADQFTCQHKPLKGSLHRELMKP